MNLSGYPIVSVITPCFNDGHFLYLPLEAIDLQTYKNIEHIIIDDGSTDPDTLNILNNLETCGKNNLKVIRQKNMGLPAARNAGIRMSCGDLILPLDADDRISNDAIAVMASKLISDDSIDVVYSDYQLFGNSNRVIKTGLFNSYRILYANYMPVCSMFRKNIWQKAGGYTEIMKGFEDWEFWIKLVKIGAVFEKIDAILYFSHRHTENMWLRDKNKWKILKTQIASLHPDLYSKKNLSLQKSKNKITWLEDLIYKMPTNYRATLRPFIPNSLIFVMHKLKFFRK